MSDYRNDKAKAARHCTQTLRELLVGYRTLLEDALREEGLTLAQLRLLKAVQEHGGVSGATIARTCQVTPQTLQVMFARAVRERWIIRSTSERNHRILTASLTSKGRSLLERGMAMAAEIEATLWAGVSADDVAQTNIVLGRGLANLHAEQDRRRDETGTA
jgi:DNA-binding MarR family transcriptional regulator